MQSSSLARFTLNLSMVDPSWCTTLACRAEELGFSAVSFGDSIFYPKDSDSTYPYSASGDRTFLDGAPFIDPLLMLAAISQCTSGLWLQTSVIKLSIRHPVLVAKQAASLAVLSRNRLKLGIGMSPWPDDYQVLGIPMQGKGRRFDEGIDLLRNLTAGGYVASHGSAYNIPEIKIAPVPSKRIPLLIGGHGPANIRRAARLADGWIAATSDSDKLAMLIGALNSERLNAGRSSESFEIHANGQSDRTAGGVRRMAALGVTDLNFRPGPNGVALASLRDAVGQLERLADDLRE